MKIINKTNWRTSDLKKILIRAVDKDNKIEGKCQNAKYLEVEIVDCPPTPKWEYEYYKNRNEEYPHPQGRKAYTGWAFLKGNKMQLRLPKDWIDKKRLVKLFIHELTHIRGYKHYQMDYWKTDEEIGNWMDSDTDYPIRQKEIEIKPKKEIEVKPKVDLQIKRYNHLLEVLKTKRSQLKRLQNQIKKWDQKRKYYETVLTANRKIQKK